MDNLEPLPFLSKSLKKRTGPLSVPVANIFGLNCRWWAPSMPFLVLLPLSAILFLDHFEAPSRPSTGLIPSPETKVKGYQSEGKQPTKMYTEVLRGCGNQIRHSQITFPFLPLLIHCTHLACFLVLLSQDFFAWLPTLPWNDEILHLGGYWRATKICSKNMLRKSILIGLFVLKNNRTTGEPKINIFREDRKGNCPQVLFSGRLQLAQGNGGVFRTGGYGRYRCQWVNYIYSTAQKYANQILC